jgi:hypothetical protein
MAKKPTKKLVYAATNIAVKQNDSHTIPNVGTVTVESIHVARKKSGQGRVKLRLADGRLQDFSPSVINAIWIIT